LACCCGGTGNLNLNFKLGHYRVFGWFSCGGVVLVSSVSNTTRCSRDAWLKHSVVLSKRQSFRTVVFSIIFFFVYFRIQNDEKTGFDGRREVSTKSARS
jgi:hypothetical protein